MNKPHIHADLIKAWAEGTEIEWFNKNVNHWINLYHPRWLETERYRIKPKVKTIKFRVIRDNQQRSNLPRFIQWLGDWQEYTIEEPAQKENCICEYAPLNAKRICSCV